MKLIPMEPAKAREALKGHIDILTPLAKAEHAAFLAATCPQCHSGNLRKSVDKERPFSADKALASITCHCIDCKCDFSLDSGVISSAPGALILE
jgi:hypothetical protein